MNPLVPLIVCFGILSVALLCKLLYDAKTVGQAVFPAILLAGVGLFYTVFLGETVPNDMARSAKTRELIEIQQDMLLEDLKKRRKERQQ